MLSSLLRKFEGSPLASQLPNISVFTKIATSDLLAFGNALVGVRQAALKPLQKRTIAIGDQNLGSALNLLNAAIVATNALSANTYVDRDAKSGTIGNDSGWHREGWLDSNNTPRAKRAHSGCATGMVGY
jgi:hypothetical protein